MASDSTIWYRVGYALERARAGSASDAEGPAPERRSRSETAERPIWPTADDLLASGAVALAGKLLGAWRPAGKVTFTRLLRAGLAGAGAALLVDLARPLVRGRAEVPDMGSDTGARMLAGAGQGLLYGALVEPRVPGPALVKGAVFALADYMAHPAGGLSRLLGAHAPHARLPMVADLLDGLEPHEQEYVEHLAFGIVLAVLCGPSPSLDGSRDDDSRD
jgi:hypothetical protein